MPVVPVYRTLASPPEGFAIFAVCFPSATRLFSRRFPGQKSTVFFSRARCLPTLPAAAVRRRETLLKRKTLYVKPFWTNFEAREKLRKGEKRNACKRAEGCMPSHVGVWHDKDLPCDLCRHSRTCCPFYTSRPLPGDGDSTRQLCGHGAVEPTQRSPSDNTLDGSTSQR